MEKMIVVVFENELKAVAGLRALRELDRQGEISVYDAQVIVREPNGSLRTVDNVDLSGFPAIVGGTAVGALVGLLGGPIGALVGGTAGALVGCVADAREMGVTQEFVNDIEAALTPGKAAVAASMEEGEDWLAPVDIAMENAGGVVFRRIRTYEKERQEDIDAAAHRAEMEQLKAERAKARGERLAKIDARIDHLRVKLENAIERKRLKMQMRQQEREAKIKALQAKANKAEGDIRRRQEARIAELRRDYLEKVAAS
jgi:uncharacterized membrane protein